MSLSRRSETPCIAYRLWALSRFETVVGSPAALDPLRSEPVVQKVDGRHHPYGAVAGAELV